MQRNSASNLLFRGNKGVLYVSLRPQIDDPLLIEMVILWSNEPPIVFQLKHFDTVLMELAATEASDVPDVEILWINEKDKSLLPLDMEISEEGVAKMAEEPYHPQKQSICAQISSYNLPAKRLKLMEKQIQKRARLLLECV